MTHPCKLIPIITVILSQQKYNTNYCTVLEYDATSALLYEKWQIFSFTSQKVIQKTCIVLMTLPLVLRNMMSEQLYAIFILCKDENCFYFIGDDRKCFWLFKWEQHGKFPNIRLLKSSVLFYFWRRETEYSIALKIESAFKMKIKK